MPNECAVTTNRDYQVPFPQHAVQPPTWSFSGSPLLIFSMLLFGWRSSPSTNWTRKMSASCLPIVDFPHPEAPMTMMRAGETLCGFSPG